MMKKLSKTLKKKDLKPIERNTPMMRKIKKIGWRTKLPILRQRFRKKVFPRGYDTQAGQYIPVNLSVGVYETEVIPLKIMDHFIDKAGTIALIQCPCRVLMKCKNHNIDLGCVWMGKGAANLDLENLPRGAKGRFSTKEEAKIHVRAAIKDGLAPTLGKLLGDALSYNVLKYRDEFMNFCFCCSCCCITAAGKYFNSDSKNVSKRMKGVTFITDPEKCTACGKCFKVCIYDGLKLKKGKSAHTKNCMGCGHCEIVCPNGAISITFDDNMDIDEVMDEIIQRYEKIVDISG